MPKQVTIYDTDGEPQTLFAIDAAEAVRLSKGAYSYTNPKASDEPEAGDDEFDPETAAMEAARHHEEVQGLKAKIEQLDTDKQKAEKASQDAAQEVASLKAEVERLSGVLAKASAGNPEETVTSKKGDDTKPAQDKGEEKTSKT